MNINIFLMILSLGTLALVIFIFFKLRDKDSEERNKSSLLDEKLKTFSDDINKISKELTSVTTPINELNRFLGGNVTSGRIGEWSLESIVKDIMPDDSYRFQYKINPKNDFEVDCAVFTADEILIPIDSKFYSGQYKNYQNASKNDERKIVLRDLKNSILKDAEEISPGISIVFGEVSLLGITFIESDFRVILHPNSFNMISV